MKGGQIDREGWSVYLKYTASGVIMRIMDVVGESDLMAVKGKNIRIAYRGLTEPVTVIGNIINDEWFDYRSVKF